MAWFGEITSFTQQDSNWIVGVSYYNDISADVRIPQTLRFPLAVTKAEVVTAIRDRGQEVRRVAAINEENFVGIKISIP